MLGEQLGVSWILFADSGLRVDGARRGTFFARTGTSGLLVGEIL